ncbi:MAG: serine/threonine protein kinase [Solirubrobacterales bacterium]|nr:serine/threonine protein kinase [Solirubrobacterales bacterium]
MSTLLGTILSGRYRLEARIGAGGMSTVYRALDETLERMVAIKLLNREVSSDSDELERFRREARAVAQLSHPHIVGVIDAGEDEGRPYIVFEYVEGETLKERIRRLGALPIPEAVAYAIEIARALGTAHARHIVHRDVKPQNVLIDEEGSAKVTDFGIARTLDEEGLTADGRVIGTTDYVSPEQALGQAVTGQSDLYSLGIVLYEMLTGEVPFRGDSQVAVAMKHVREPLPDVQRGRPEISAALASVVDRATAKRPDDRYRDDAELIADLEDVLAIEAARSGSVTGEVTAVIRTLPNQTRRLVPFRLRHRAIAILLLLLAAAAVVAGVVWLGSRAHRGAGTLAIKPPHQYLQQVSPCGTCAQGFNPLGSPSDEAPNASLAIDNQLGTYWDTQQYYDHKLDKAGTGIYVDFGTRSPDGTPGRFLRIIDATPGFTVTIYARHDAPPMHWPDPGWTAVSAPTVVGQNTSIPLTSAGTRYRYFLVWITDLGGHEQLSIDELVLYAYR